MEAFDDILDVIGNTPLVRLTKVTTSVRPQIYAKLELLNPGGSLKDRVALGMIRDAEDQGLLAAGATIVEPTTGDTGAALAMVAARKGYRCIFTMPDKGSSEQINLLRAYGAEVVLCPTDVPAESPESYYRVAERLAEGIPGAFMPNQFTNPANPEAHYGGTGPEIWRQAGGRIEVLVAGLQTGGTATGAARYLKEQNPRIRLVGADPEGSVYSEKRYHPYLVEGIGSDFWPRTLDRTLVDDVVTVSDRQSFLAARRLAREEGILAGGSSGTVLAAALEVARELDESQVIVAIFPDTGRNYLSKLFSDRWMRRHSLLAPAVPEVRVADVLGYRPPSLRLICVSSREKVEAAIDTLQRYRISQLPVVRDGAAADLSSIIGSIHERGLLAKVFESPENLNAPVIEVMDPPLPVVNLSDDIEEAFVRLAESPAVIVAEAGRPVGVLTSRDLLEYIAHRRTTGGVAAAGS